ncbi:MAG: hypothetical protein VX460_14620 [Planctomycetota bacterium]|nr:hypothetical protein [Planctomycetota bacterium]
MGLAHSLRRTIAALPLVAATVLLGACSAPTAKVMPFIASIGLDGDLSIQDSGGVAASSSFGDLGVGDDEAAIGGMARIGFGAAELSVAGVGIDYTGSGTAASDFDLDGNTIAAGAAVDTEVDLQMTRALFTWDLVPVGGIDLGIGVGATLLDLRFDLQEQGGPNRITTDQVIPVPMIGARAAWEWGPVDLRADVGGLVIELDGDEATVIDGELSAAVDFLKMGELVVGYRVTSIDAQYGDSGAKVDADFDLEGYYLGLQFGF